MLKKKKGWYLFNIVALRMNLSPVALVHTPTPPFTSSESLGKPCFTSLHNAIQTSVHLMELHKY